MKKGLKATLALLLGATFMAMPLTQVKAETQPPPNYVALGDSIAAGVLYSSTDPYYGNTKTENGYTYDLQATLARSGFTVKLNDDFCVPGKTAQKLAAESAEPIFQSLIKDAQLVTLDVGANDLLGNFYGYALGHQKELLGFATNTLPDQEKATIVKDLTDAINKDLDNLYYHNAGTDVKNNIEIILQNILKANPNAQIYVMGYYNPLPALKNYGMDLTLPTAYFNTFIYKAICNVRAKKRGASISYVETLLPMADGVNRKLLYPTDIHPTIEGYQLIANLFWQRIKLNYLITQYVNTRVH